MVKKKKILERRVVGDAPIQFTATPLEHLHFGTSFWSCKVCGASVVALSPDEGWDIYNEWFREFFYKHRECK